MPADGPGYMCKIDGIMYEHLYRKILEDYLIQTIKFYQLNTKNLIF